MRRDLVFLWLSLIAVALTTRWLYLPTPEPERMEPWMNFRVKMIPGSESVESYVFELHEQAGGCGNYSGQLNLRVPGGGNARYRLFRVDGSVQPPEVRAFKVNLQAHKFWSRPSVLQNNGPATLEFDLSQGEQTHHFQVRADNSDPCVAEFNNWLWDPENPVQKALVKCRDQAASCYYREAGGPQTKSR